MNGWLIGFGYTVVGLLAFAGAARFLYEEGSNDNGDGVGMSLAVGLLWPVFLACGVVAGLLWTVFFLAVPAYRHKRAREKRTAVQHAEELALQEAERVVREFGQPTALIPELPDPATTAAKVAVAEFRAREGLLRVQALNNDNPQGPRTLLFGHGEEPYEWAFKQTRILR